MAAIWAWAAKDWGTPLRSPGPPDPTLSDVRGCEKEFSLAHNDEDGMTRRQILRRAAAISAVGLSELLTTDSQAVKPNMPEDTAMHTQSDAIQSATPHSADAKTEVPSPHR